MPSVRLVWQARIALDALRIGDLDLTLGDVLGLPYGGGQAEFRLYGSGLG